MKHKKNISRIKELLNSLPAIELAMVYGSYARDDYSPNSDLDIHILINQGFDTHLLMEKLKSILTIRPNFTLTVNQKDKLVYYFTNSPKIEFTITNDSSKLRRDIIGSEIKDIEKCILYQNQNNPKVIDLINELKTNNPEYLNESITDNYINELIDRFLYEFENCSSAHFRSDGYRFYFFYNIALHCLIQLEAFEKNVRNFNFLPKQLTSKILTETDDQKAIYDLSGSIYLPDGNKKKRALLNRFYETIKHHVNDEKKSEIRHFCEGIFKRDSFWNFRDLNQNISQIAPGKLYRSALLVIYQYDDQLIDLIESKNITNIIDLRASREIIEFKYNPFIQSKVKYVHAPMDPWEQPDWFQKDYQIGSNAEIAYKFFIICCQESIVTALREIIHAEGAVVIHCHAGKDRTGIFSAILSLIVGSEIEHIYQDYMASESDTQPSLLKIALDYIEECGGINSYLQKAGLNQNEVSLLQKKLTNA